MPVVTKILAEQPSVNELGSNWRIQFFDADGSPLAMDCFDEIDFGAIAYKEIFQNVKTILATPIYSCPLARTLGTDQSVVDQPMNQATGAVIAMIDALYFWEPRAEIANVDFLPDMLSGHLEISLKLKIKNLIYGTTTPYEINSVFGTPPETEGGLPPMNIPVPGPPGPQGPAGPQGPPGSNEAVIPDPLSIGQINVGATLMLGTKTRITVLSNGYKIEAMDGAGVWQQQQQVTES